MSANKYRFVSPGIFLTEIDQSQLPRQAAEVGPAVIGRTQRGPAMRPVTVNSFLDFVELFGNPIPGGEGGDVWREGNRTSPTYASYAARAWLKSGSPLTVVRVLGETRTGASAGNGEAGWKTVNTPNSALASNGGAFGLFVASASSSPVVVPATYATCSLDITGVLVDGEIITLTTVAGGDDTKTVNDEIPIAPPAGGGADNTARAEACVLAINGSSYFSASNVSGTITISASVAGADGNTHTVTTDFSNATLTTGPGDALAGGTDASTTPGAAADGGTLAAIWYLNTGSIRLAGDNLNGSETTNGACEFISSNGGDFQFKAIIEDAAGNPVVTSSFNFNPNDGAYIRKSFNTDPTRLGEITPSAATYFLGETYERNLEDTLGSTAALAGNAYGVIVGLTDGCCRKVGSQTAQTGKVIGQATSPDTGSYDPADMPTLFSLKAIDTGEWANSNIKISISDISAPTNPDFNPYGSFTVEVRDARDTDTKKRVLEMFTNCNLNPNSADYLPVKIGDKYAEWSDNERRFTEYGDYANKSKYIYVDMESTQYGSDYLPFGFQGPDTYVTTTGAVNSTGSAPANWQLDIPHSALTTSISGAAGSTGSFTLTGPSMALRVSSSEGGFTDPTEPYFGITTDRAGSTSFERSYIDLARYLPTDATKTTVADGGNFVFSLDNIAYVSSSGGIENQVVYNTTNRVDGLSITAGGPTPDAESGGLSPSYTRVLDAGINRFTMPLVGGFDGFDIYDQDPIRNTKTSEGGNSTEYNNYAFNSVKRAIDTIADPEVVNISLATVPGVTTPALTTHLIDVCETRADALAIIDLEDGYLPSADSNDPPEDRVGSVNSTVSALKDRSLNSSYGCSYYPWVQTKDEFGAGLILWVPPSVAALGTFASNDKKAAPWFAPAGFTRGGLSDGAAGIPVIGVREHLTRKMRDKLYENNVNPIAKFPAEGIVIFGQKTLQATQSALDRVNVRRMMLYVKKGISNIASTTLFDNNGPATWSRFLARAEPFLADVQAQMGLTDYKIVLDETTTTPDLIDRNVMYAKVFLKPARSIEFIAIDFIIQKTGASFED